MARSDINSECESRVIKRIQITQHGTKYYDNNKLCEKGLKTRVGSNPSNSLAKISASFAMSAKALLKFGFSTRWPKFRQEMYVFCKCGCTNDKLSTLGEISASSVAERVMYLVKQNGNAWHTLNHSHKHTLFPSKSKSVPVCGINTNVLSLIKGLQRSNAIRITVNLLLTIRGMNTNWSIMSIINIRARPAGTGLGRWRLRQGIPPSGAGRLAAKIQPYAVRSTPCCPVFGYMAQAWLEHAKRVCYLGVQIRHVSTKEAFLGPLHDPCRWARAAATLSLFILENNSLLKVWILPTLLLTARAYVADASATLPPNNVYTVLFGFIIWGITTPRLSPIPGSARVFHPRAQSMASGPRGCTNGDGVTQT